ncbi:MAG: response regulator transcription factor [Helicobacter sp.]|uniref:response regulator transcription factor n=1 Tax=Helicobacter sp. TaxID=218 RepID=UPI003753B991|nr:response regulator transcription factor [Helicobacter sp.]
MSLTHNTQKSTTGAKVLLLEDDSVLAEILCEFLESEGFSVEWCQDASSALNLAYEKSFDIWLLDVKVPLGDDFGASKELPGFEVLKTLRQANKNTPCIFLTSLNSVQDLQIGYDVGCDDFLRKPFELVELRLRIHTLLKRSFAHRNTQMEDFGNGVSFDIITKTLYKDGKILSITNKETALLNLLLRYPNTYISQDRIFEELWDMGQEPSELSVRAYIKNLRKLIGKDRILNQHNKGYCYVR